MGSPLGLEGYKQELLGRWVAGWSLQSMHPWQGLVSFTPLRLSPGFPTLAKREKTRSSGLQVTTSSPAEPWSSLKMGRVSIREGSQQCGGGKGAVGSTMTWAPFPLRTCYCL